MIRFLPEAVGSLRSGLLQVNPRLEEAARASVGRATRSSARSPPRSSPPAALGGVALVFISAVKELPVTLLLSPIGFKTLATATWTASASGLLRPGGAAGPAAGARLGGDAPLAVALGPPGGARAGAE